MTDHSTKSRPRILVCGATGQVGSALIKTLAPHGEVIAAARQPSGSSCEWIALDLSDATAIARAVREVRPAIIINAAAYTAVDRAESEPEQAAALNAAAPAVLAEEARRLDAALVHYSTDYVFNGSGTRPWREDDAPRPLNVYGRTKLAGEEAIRAAGVAHLILRISWIYAPRGQNFVRTMLRIGSEREELRVVADQCGAPTPARLVADATARVIAEIADAPVEKLRARGGTLHLPCGGETNWHDFAEEIFRLARQAGWPLKIQRVVPIATADYPTPATRPLNSRLDGTRAAERFGLRLPDWRAALADEFPAILAEQAGGRDNLLVRAP